jgi:hypothetical protein
MLDHAGWLDDTTAPPSSSAITISTARGKIMITIAVNHQIKRTAFLLIN